VLIVSTAKCYSQRVSAKMLPDAVYKNMDEYLTANGASAAQA
jgi:hypothetical protein